MTDDLQKRIEEAMRNPQNMGELTGADAVGTVGNSDCGEMLRMWVKFKEDKGKKVIDRATFQSFGCETAIAAISVFNFPSDRRSAGASSDSASFLGCSGRKAGGIANPTRDPDLRDSRARNERASRRHIHDGQQ